MEARELRQIFVLANDFKEGDLSVGGARDEDVREEARRAIVSLRVGDIRRVRLVDDGVTEALERPGKDAKGAGSDALERTRDLDPLTVADIRDALLGLAPPPGWTASRRGCQRGDRRRRQGDDRRRAVVGRARAVQSARGDGVADRLAAATSARASSRTALATTRRRSCFRSSKGCRTAAATSSSGSTPRATTSTRSCGSSELLAQVVAAARAADPLLRALRHRQAARARASARGSTSASRAWPARRRRSPAWSASTWTASLDLARGLRRLLLRDRPGIRGDQRRRRRRRHGDARSAHLRRRAAHPARRPAAVDDRQRRRRLHRS